MLRSSKGHVLNTQSSISENMSASDVAECSNIMALPEFTTIQFPGRITDINNALSMLGGKKTIIKKINEYKRHQLQLSNMESFKFEMKVKDQMKKDPNFAQYYQNIQNSIKMQQQSQQNNNTSPQIDSNFGGNNKWNIGGGMSNKNRTNNVNNDKIKVKQGSPMFNHRYSKNDNKNSINTNDNSNENTGNSKENSNSGNISSFLFGTNDDKKDVKWHNKENIKEIQSMIEYEPYLQLHFNKDCPFDHPLFGKITPVNNKLLIRVITHRKVKKKRKIDKKSTIIGNKNSNKNSNSSNNNDNQESNMINKKNNKKNSSIMDISMVNHKNEVSNIISKRYEIVGRVTKTISYQGLADFQVFSDLTHNSDDGKAKNTKEKRKRNEIDEIDNQVDNEMWMENCTNNATFLHLNIDGNNVDKDKNKNKDKEVKRKVQKSKQRQRQRQRKNKSKKRKLWSLFDSNSNIAGMSNYPLVPSVFASRDQPYSDFKFMPNEKVKYNCNYPCTNQILAPTLAVYCFYIFDV